MPFAVTGKAAGASFSKPGCRQQLPSGPPPASQTRSGMCSRPDRPSWPWGGSGRHLQPGPWKTSQAWGPILAPGLGGADQQLGSIPGAFPDARLSSCLAPACPSGLASLWCPLVWKQEWWGTEAAISTASQGVAQKFCRDNRGQCAECLASAGTSFLVLTWAGSS